VSAIGNSDSVRSADQQEKNLDRVVELCRGLNGIVRSIRGYSSRPPDTVARVDIEAKNDADLYHLEDRSSNRSHRND
jgi:hypothetical protein